MGTAVYDDIILPSKPAMSSQFPHNSREIAASIITFSGKIILWSLLAVLFAINIFARFNIAPSYWQQMILALRWPLSPDIHQTLAKNFWDNGLLQSTKTELGYLHMLRSVSPNTTNVLGEATDQNAITLWNTQKVSLQKSYDNWQNIVRQKTDFRDGFLILASLAYQRSLFTQAHAYAEQAFILDPNSNIAQKLLMVTEENKK